MGIIEVSEVTRTYGSGRERFTAVDGVSFEVAAGELVSILGVNGAGKTSLVEVVEGIAPATSGRVRVLGHDPIRSRALVRPRTGIMLQEAGFAQDLTVAETLGMWAGTLSRPRGVAEAMELTDLSHRADVRVKSLSGGERRRLDLAMATMGHPDVLFLDEPTTGLDPASRQRTRTRHRPRHRNLAVGVAACAAGRWTLTLFRTLHDRVGADWEHVETRRIPRRRCAGVNGRPLLLRRPRLVLAGGPAGPSGHPLVGVGRARRALPLGQALLLLTGTMAAAVLLVSLVGWVVTRRGTGVRVTVGRSSTWERCSR